MTIISTANPSMSLDEAMDIAEERAYQKARPSFPPVDDFVSTVKKIDWADVRRRAHHGLNNVGLVVAVVGEKVHDFGSWLAQV